MKRYIFYILGALALIGSFPMYSNALSVFLPYQGGTGTSTAPIYGQVLVGNSSGTYTLTATSSLGLSSSFSTTSISATAPLVWDISLAKLTTNFSTSTYNLFTGVNGFQQLNASSTLMVDGLSTFTYASATTISLTGSVLVGGKATTTGANGNIATEGTLSAKGAITFSGLSNGAVSVSSGLLSGGTLSVGNGGTGSTTLGGILLGNGTSAVSSTGTVAVAWGGTGANSFTLNSILVGNNNGAFIASTTLGDDVISDGLTLTNLTQITNRAISDTTGTLLVARGGTGQTSFTAGQLLYGNSTAALSSVATTSLTIGGGLIFSATPGALVGGSNLTITARVSTSSVPTIGRVAYWTGNGTPSELGDVATTSVTCSSPLSCAAFDVLTGGGALTLTTVPVASGGTGSTTLSDGRLLIGAGTSAVGATSTVSARWGGTGFSSYSVGDVLYADSANSLTRLAISGTAGQVLMVSGGVPVWAATSSASGVSSVSNNDSSLTISPTTGAVVASLNINNANTWRADQTFATTTVAAFTSTSTVIMQGNLIALATTTRNTWGTGFPVAINTGLRIGGGNASGFFLNGNSLQIDAVGNTPISATNRLIFSYNALDTAANNWAWAIGDLRTDDAIFRIASYNAGTQREPAEFTIATSTNSVGISTTTPGAMFSVHGNSLVSGTSTMANLVASGTISIASSTVIQKAWASFTYSTSTVWTGTTTIQLGTNIVKENWDKVVCYTGVGTLFAQFKNATLNMDDISVSTATSTTNFTTNNSLPALTKRSVNIGTPASSPTYISCTIEKTVNF